MIYRHTICCRCKLPLFYPDNGTIKLKPLTYRSAHYQDSLTLNKPKQTIKTFFILSALGRLVLYSYEERLLLTEHFYEKSENTTAAKPTAD